MPKQSDAERLREMIRSYFDSTDCGPHITLRRGDLAALKRILAREQAREERSAGR